MLFLKPDTTPTVKGQGQETFFPRDTYSQMRMDSSQLANDFKPSQASISITVILISG